MRIHNRESMNLHICFYNVEHWWRNGVWLSQRKINLMKLRNALTSLESFMKMFCWKFSRVVRPSNTFCNVCFRLSLVFVIQLLDVFFIFFPSSVSFAQRKHQWIISIKSSFFHPNFCSVFFHSTVNVSQLSSMMMWMVKAVFAIE